MSVWDHPDLRVGGEFIKLDNVGDTAAGVIQVIRPHKFDDGSVAPQILLVTDQGEERTLTAGQIRLKTELASQRPEAGDHIRVTLTQIEQRAGGKSLKHFAVEVQRGVGQPPQVAPPQQYAPQGFGQYTPPPAQGYPAPAQQYAPAAPPAQPYGVPQVPAGYQAPPAQQVPQGYAQQPPAQQQQYAPPAPAAPVQQAPAQPAAPAGAPALTPEQQAAMAALTPEQRAALGWA